MLGLEKLGELEGWTPTRQILTAAYGAEETAKMTRRLAEITETNTAILSLVPSFSRLPGAE